jgi:hypothetical protein
MAINQQAPGDNGYKAFFKGKSIDLYAPSSYKAQLVAAAHFKARKSYDVSVVLCELNGEQVTHSTAAL